MTSNAPGTGLSLPAERVRHLQRLGIDVWVKRRPGAGRGEAAPAAQVVPCQDATGPAAGRGLDRVPPVDEGDRHLRRHEDRPATPAPTRPVPASAPRTRRPHKAPGAGAAGQAEPAPVSLAHRHTRPAVPATLGARDAAAAGAGPGAAGAPGAMSDQESAVGAGREAGAPVRLRIRCFHYGGVFCALAEDAWPHRRLLLDVARALGSFRAAERRDVVFDWPPPGVPGDAGRAFRAFIGHQTRASELAAFAGAQTAALLGESAPQEAAWLGAEGRRWLYLPAEALDAAAKRRLWSLVKAPPAGNGAP